MNLNIAILREKEIHEDNQRVVDTHVVYEDFTLEELYCDDTEVIEEHLDNYRFTSEYHKQVAEWLEELKAYKDAEEQGLLLKLPCKVGDKFWVIAYKSKVIIHVKCSGYAIQEDITNGIKNSYVWLDSVENPRDYWKLDFDDFKKQCFKTKEEAEQALAEMKGV